MKWLLLAIVVQVTTYASAAQPDCKEFVQEKILVDTFYASLSDVANGFQFPLWAAHPPGLGEMLNRPLGSSCWLVRELKEVHRRHLKLPETRRSRPVWAIRALRYLTNCTDFRGRLANEQALDPDSARGQFLLRDGVLKIPFFGTSMSSDSAVLAPVEVQREVIAKWRKWYATQAATFQFGACGDVDNWYF